jgi:arsenite methyltransferase
MTIRPQSRSTRAVLSVALLPLMTGCHVASRLDYTNLFSRGGWQLTDQVVDTLTIQPGDVVADLGAGDGYFSFYLADAVGPEGRVYAVDVDEEKIEALRREVQERGYPNIEVVLGTSDDPRLPDGSVDLIFFCNAYHHFDDRVRYLENLRRDLSPGARIAIVDGKPEGRLFIPKGHILPDGQLVAELEQARYRHVASHDFLPIQSFDVFETPGGAGGVALPRP